MGELEGAAGAGHEGRRLIQPTRVVPGDGVGGGSALGVQQHDLLADAGDAERLDAGSVG